MSFILNVIDENGNEIPFSRIKAFSNCGRCRYRDSVPCDEITIQIFDKKDIFTDDFSLKELRWLRTAMIDMVYDGGTPETMRGYLNVLDKIEKIIKRKWDK